VRAGDVVEASATLVRVGRRSREMRFELRVLARGEATDGSASGARMLDESMIATTATGTCVVPARR
jgi:3-aminobutyryl-CoA ammonia-lyase